MGIEINHKLHHVGSIVLPVCYAIAFVFLSYLSTVLIEDFSNNDQVDNLSSFMYVYGAISYLSYCIMHMLVTSLIYTRLAMVNECLKMSINSKDTDHLMIVRKIRILHMKMVETVELYNFCFTFNTIFYNMQFMFFLIINLFRLFHFFTSSTFLIEDLNMMILTYTFNFYYFSGVLWLVLFSSWIESEGNYTLILLQTFTLSYNDSKTLQAVKLAKLQMSHKKVVISCGLFEINWNFLTTMIGSIISYLIILIQFNSSQIK